MTEKKIVVPQGMLEAAVDAFMVDWERRNDAYRSSAAGRAIEDYWRATYTKALTAALLWLSENPIKPTQEQEQNLSRDAPERCDIGVWMAVEFQRIMFTPEPEVPEAVKDLVWSGVNNHVGDHNRDVLEAYRRGVEAGKQ